MREAGVRSVENNARCELLCMNLHTVSSSGRAGSLLRMRLEVTSRLNIHHIVQPGDRSE